MDPPHSHEPSTASSNWLGAFAHPAFAVVWIASTTALIGIAMYDTASGWLMTTLDVNPLDVSLVHVATSLPMFLFTLPAGAIADIVNPRRLIVAVSCAIVALISIFAALVSFDLASPVMLLLTTFLLSAAWALNSPAWLSILPYLVPKADLSGAIAAHGVGYNLSRTVGPALGGFIIVHYGMATPLWAFVVANLGVIASLIWWRGPCKQTGSLPAERLNGAVRTGIRHAVNNRLLRATLVRTLAVYLFAAAYWGLLPLIARRTGEGAEHYGMLLSMISAGAIVGSLGQRLFRDRIDLDWTVALGTLGTAAALAIFAWTEDFAGVLAACFLAGAAWVIVLTALYVSAQNVLPEWVRGRGLAIFLTMIFGAMTAGSAAWGQVASKLGLTEALALAAVGVLLAIPLTWRWKLQKGEAVDLTPSLHWNRPETAEAIADDRGPVLVKIEYRIDPKDRTRFLRALDELGEERKRDGAFAWGIFEDMSEFGRFEEGYLIQSWLELMHLRERVTNEYRMLEDEIREMLIQPPHIEFLVAPERQPHRRSRPEPVGA
jgi:predicted MFS family arabinose efflux permease